ncbi:hypothetical protein C0J45_24009, partial [Silurus meridionalis]
IQTRSTVLTPGQSLTLSCKVSGYSVTSTYCTHWIRQPAGKTLEWIGEICHDGSTYYSEKLKSRFQVTRDTSSNTVTLTGQNMQTEDTAVYYCARRSQYLRRLYMFLIECRIECIDDYLGLFYFTGFHSDEIRMDQSPAVVKKPGESVKISCKINGFDMTEYYIHWIRQKPGKALEWIGRMDAGKNDAEYAESLKNQFVLTEDVSACTQYLEAKSLRTEDTAVYYCARQATVTETEEAALQKPHTHF